MRSLVLVMMALSLGAVQAGPTNSPPAPAQRVGAVGVTPTNGPVGNATSVGALPAVSTNALAAPAQQLTTQPPELTPLLASLPKPNELLLGRFKISGILVEAVKIDQPLQLINPFAPSKYGSPEDNVLRDNAGKVSALKIFSFHF